MAFVIFIKSGIILTGLMWFENIQENIFPNQGSADSNRLAKDKKMKNCLVYEYDFKALQKLFDNC